MLEKLTPVVGVGTDIVDIRRIEKLLGRFGNHFIAKVFTPTEQAWCSMNPHAAACYAKRFAAKEALLKALGTGMRQGIHWHDMEIRRSKEGQPTLHLTEALQTIAQHRFGASVQAFVSISDEPPYALAFVVISRQ